MYSVTVGPCVIKAFRLKEEYINAKTDMLTCDWNPNIMQMKNQNVSVSVSLFNRGRDETLLPVHILLDMVDYQRMRTNKRPLLWVEQKYISY